jgi:lipoate---protein ligase
LKGLVNPFPSIRLLDLTLPAPEENLACDEALLDWGEETPGRAVLRFWESSLPFVVLGLGNIAAQEADLEACRQDGIRVLRRCSGGGTVLQGPGCLNYTLVLEIESHPELSGITGTNRFILERNRTALTPLLPPRELVQVQGFTDLTLENLKFSGNAQKRKRRCLLFHGTFLLRLDSALVQRYLRMPPRQPDYRRNRPHRQFLTNLPSTLPQIKAALVQAWNANQILKDWPQTATARLVREKYSSADWNLRR